MINQVSIDAKSFHSKVLLFGEYSIIQDSMALATPYPLFSGTLSFHPESKKDPELQAFARYIKEILDNSNPDFHFDFDSFQFDVEQGLCFSSSIPQGYGVGSSGALVAAIFHRYAKKYVHGHKNKTKDISQLRRYFTKLESHFHGKSSGLDPLISYLDHSLLILGNKKISTVDFPLFSGDNGGGIFLLNTGRQRRTEPLVNLFLEKCDNAQFHSLCQKQLIPITNDCIIQFLEGNLTLLFENFKRLSSFQYEHLRPMIPPLFRKMWEEGMNTNKFLLKLCGAGGGGFLLGLSPNLEETSKLLGATQIRPLIRF